MVQRRQLNLYRRARRLGLRRVLRQSSRVSSRRPNGASSIAPTMNQNERNRIRTMRCPFCPRMMPAGAASWCWLSATLGAFRAGSHPAHHQAECSRGVRTVQSFAAASNSAP